MKRWVLCVLAGALVAQVWGMISWMALPWHNVDMRTFKDDGAVAAVMKEQLQGDGLYVLPNMSRDMHSDKAAMQAWDEKASAGPFAFMSVRASGITPGMGLPMAIGFLLNIVVAAMLFWLVNNSSITCPKGRTVFIATAALTGGMLCHVANWCWWNFPPISTAVNVIDIGLTWAFAGFAMVKLSDRLSK